MSEFVDAAANPVVRIGRHPATTHAEISHTGLRLFIERGFDQVTVDEIAAACGMRNREHWLTVLVMGILTVLVGAVVFLFPAASLFVFAIFAGVQLIFTGILMIQSGSQFRRIAGSA